MAWKAVAVSVESVKIIVIMSFQLFMTVIMIMIISSEFLENFVIKTKRCKVNSASVTVVKKNRQQKN